VAAATKYSLGQFDEFDTYLNAFSRKVFVYHEFESVEALFVALQFYMGEFMTLDELHSVFVCCMSFIDN
jgi:hypothetical protein